MCDTCQEPFSRDAIIEDMLVHGRPPLSSKAGSLRRRSSVLRRPTRDGLCSPLPCNVGPAWCIYQRGPLTRKRRVLRVLYGAGGRRSRGEDA
jgi:hypothetical protein